MTERLDPAQLRRMVDAMAGHVDPRADQNIWNIARAAAGAVEEPRGTMMLTREQRAMIDEFNAAGQSPTGRMQMSPIPLTQGQRPDVQLEFAKKRLRNLAHILSPSQPITEEQLCATAEAVMNELTRLREELTAKAKVEEACSEADKFIKEIAAALGAGEGVSLVEHAKNVIRKLDGCSQYEPERRATGLNESEDEA